MGGVFGFGYPNNTRMKHFWSWVYGYKKEYFIYAVSKLAKPNTNLDKKTFNKSRWVLNQQSLGWEVSPFHAIKLDPSLL